MAQVELPPRARRIRLIILHPVRHVGTTSACAENTHNRSSRNLIQWNYLRVRGEYFTSTMRWAVPAELPPRARRIHTHPHTRGTGLGTTSACAENTSFSSPIISEKWNYLRVRGEYWGQCFENHFEGELPPRARRILPIGEGEKKAGGTTSACAENTLNRCSLAMTWMELPPRARRIPALTDRSEAVQGTTSACAENTCLLTD